jgi:hypothetical protein
MNYKQPLFLLPLKGRFQKLSNYICKSILKKSTSNKRMNANKVIDAVLKGKLKCR